MEITDVLKDALDKIKTIMDVETVVGSPIVNNEYVRVIPITKMSLGFAGLGGELEGKKMIKDKELPLGGIGAGANIEPVGFLVVNGERVKFLSLSEGEDKWEKRLENIVEYFGK
ncbi:MAG: sporulation protein YtfJ [Clostridia bacterium]|nr:sporulation protein YtfJ [Clostridia bacterium]